MEGLGLVLRVGEKVHVVTRRQYEEDVRRHFVGAVTAVDMPVARLEGYAFVYNPATSEYERRPDRRTRLLPLDDVGLLVNILPDHVDIDAVHYAHVDGHLVATDGDSYTLDVNEFGPRA